MSYYKGDYYRGDYYRGDPFLGLGALGAMAGKWLGKKFFSRGAKKLATTAVVGGVSGSLLSRALTSAGTTWNSTAGQYLARLNPVQLAAHMASTGAVTGLMSRPFSPSGQLPEPGFRGRVRRFLPGGETGYYKRRRMNVANPRALRRSLRRVAGFGKLASRARRDIGRAASAVGCTSRRMGPVARHHARIRRAA